MKKTILILLILVTFAGMTCKKNSEYISGQFKQISDIAYKKGETDYEKDRCKLDLYLPENIQNFPVMVWFHGGGLYRGDKSEDHAAIVGRLLASRGIGVALANYRLDPDVNYPDFIEDAASAVAWTVTHIKQYKGNNNQIFVGGHSAGAYLSAMIALDNKYLNRYGISDDCLAGAVLLSGQMNSHFTVKKERGISESQIVVDETAPKFHASQIGPPCLVLVAENDSESTKIQNRELVSLLKNAGQKTCYYHEIPGQDHGSTVMAINDPENQTAGRIISFINVCISND